MVSCYAHVFVLLWVVSLSHCPSSSASYIPNLSVNIVATYSNYVAYPRYYQQLQTHGKDFILNMEETAPTRQRLQVWSTYRMSLLKRTVSCGTTPMWLRRELCVTCDVSHTRKYHCLTTWCPVKTYLSTAALHRAQ